MVTVSAKQFTSWDVDLVTMANAVGDGFPDLVLPAYIAPTLDAHATLASTLSRTKEDSGRFLFDYRSSPGDIDLTLCQALALMALACTSAAKHFGLSVELLVTKFESSVYKAFGQEATNAPVIPS